MADVFGVLASGRLIRTDFTQMDPTHFMMQLNNPQSLNHIAVFLTGTIPFPVGTAGLVYFSWSKGSEQNGWKLLGSISNEKPSAIFKISHAKPSTHVNDSHFNNFNSSAVLEDVAIIGISIEPIDVVTQQTLPLLNDSYSNPSVALEFTKSMLSNFYNYASSFIVTADCIRQSMDDPTRQYVPLNVLGTWFSNFQRKLFIDANFWKK